MPRPWAAETADRLPEAERVEVGHGGLVGGAVDLVGDDDHGQIRPAQDLGDLGVALAQPGAGIEHDRDRVGVGDRHAGLVLDGARQRVLGGEVNPAGVDQVEAHAVPLALERLAVARHARLLVDDRLAAADEPVDQGRLADVRIADDRDPGQTRVGHGAAIPRPRAISATRETTSATSSPVVSTSTASSARRSAPCVRSRSRRSRSRWAASTAS